VQTRDVGLMHLLQILETSVPKSVIIDYLELGSLIMIDDRFEIDPFYVSCTFEYLFQEYVPILTLSGCGTILVCTLRLVTQKSISLLVETKVQTLLAHRDLQTDCGSSFRSFEHSYHLLLSVESQARLIVPKAHRSCSN
jgi:hypothetical protein